MPWLWKTPSLTSGEITALARRVVDGNADIFAMAIAFEPYGMSPDRLFFAPYCHRSGGNVAVTQLGGPDYRYFYMDWYQLPKELERPVWTEPYRDEGGGGVLMTTFAAPFYRLEKGRRSFAGVVTADISLDWLQRNISGIHLFDTGYAFVISRNGTFISHPVESLLLNESIFSLAEGREDEELWRIGRSMSEGGTGFLERDSVRDGRPSFLFYTPLPLDGWSMGVLLPKQEVLSEASALQRNMLLIGLCGFVLLAAAVIWLARSITKPVRLLSDGAMQMASGDLDASLPDIRANDEVGDLAAAFLHMRDSLKEHIRNLTDTTAQKERIESELRIARDIQMGILPKLFPAFPDHQEFDVFASIEPAKEVGGDLYDFFFIDERRFCFLIGDVSDKGVPAAFFMAVTKTLLKAVAAQGFAPGEILRRVNNDLAEKNDSCMFVTLFLAVLDIDSGEVSYACAGHNPPVLLKSDGVSWVPPMNEPMAGAMEEIDYSTQVMTLAPGETLFLYTDGVTEAMNEQQELYSDERLLEVLDVLRDSGVERIVTTVAASICEHTGGAAQSDDITMLALRFAGRMKRFKEKADGIQE